LKNDFTVWGTKASANGSSIDIHARYAIDQKPQKYTSPWAHYEAIPNLVLAYRCLKIDNNYYLDTRTGIVSLSTTLPKELYLLDTTLTLCQYSTLDKGDSFYLLTTSQSEDEITFTTDLEAQEIYYIYEQVSENTYHLVDNSLYSFLYTKIEDNSFISLNDGVKLTNYMSIY
jgi:hypothetical protein